MSSPFSIIKEINSGASSFTIGTLPAGAAIEDVKIYVLTAFDSAATVTVGYSSDEDAYSTSQAITSLGRKAPSLGTGIGHDATSRVATAYISGSPTVGKAYVMLYGYLLPPS